MGSLWLTGYNSSLWNGYAIGLAYAFLQVMRLSFSPNKNMEADFVDSYQDYLR